MRHIRPLFILIAFCSYIPMLNAQTTGHGDHDARQNESRATAAPSDSTTEYKVGMDRMHRDMAIQYSGNADVDFARSMIPHHQGAIDMAKVQLRYGSDPALRRLAQEVIRAQEKEIAFLRQWLKKHAADSR